MSSEIHDFARGIVIAALPRSPQEHHVTEKTASSSGSGLACQILTYFAAHPEAQDTLEGVVEWWLLEQEIRRRTTAVKKALSELVARDFLLARTGKDGRTRYQMNPAKITDVRTLLIKRPKMRKKTMASCS